MKSEIPKRTVIGCKALHGGSFFDEPNSITNTCRIRCIPKAEDFDLGLRLVMVSDQVKTIKGGWFFSDPDRVRVTSRGNSTSIDSDFDVGLRLVVLPGEGKKQR